MRRWGYDPALDRWAGHDYPGVLGAGFTEFELMEIELGGRVALAFEEEDQAWWETVGRDLGGR